MPDELLNFEEHRRQRDEEAATVRCARCGKRIPATAIQCPDCGVHFSGEAQNFFHPSEQTAGKDRPSVWVMVTAIVLLAASLAGILATFILAV